MFLADPDRRKKNNLANLILHIDPNVCVFFFWELCTIKLNPSRTFSLCSAGSYEIMAMLKSFWKSFCIFLWANAVNIWQPLSGSYTQRMLSVFPPAAQNKLLSIPLAALADCSMKCFPNVYTLCVNRRRPFIASEVGVTFSMNAPEEVMSNIYWGKENTETLPTYPFNNK